MSGLNPSLKKMIGDEKICHNESQFYVRNRIETWQKQASLYFDDDLDKLKTAMLKVFKENDPKFELEKDKRPMARINGKNLNYSHELRKGLAVSLALVGYYNNLLINCSQVKRKNFASEVIHEILDGISWKQLATLDLVLPFFAEADPDAFLTEINILAKNQDTIKDLVADEGNIFQGGSHWLGISQSLEILAWEPEYFARVVDLLAKLSLLDQDKPIHPRPKSVLIQIFIPWHVQTAVPIEKLIATAKVLTENYPELGWEILSSALDKQYSSFNQRPSIRKNLAPPAENRHVDLNAVEKIKDAYKNIMLNMAASDVCFIEKLLHHFYRFLDTPYFEKVLQIVSSPLVLKTNDEIKEKIWSRINKIVFKHCRKKHQDPQQPISEEKISRLREIVALVQPKSILQQKKHLFGWRYCEWFESDDYDTEEEKLQKDLDNAAWEIYRQNGIDGIVTFANLIENPKILGMAAKNVAIDVDKTKILHFLVDTSSNLRGFIAGYLQMCFDKGREEWLNSFLHDEWSDEEKTAFLCCLPFTSSVWHFAEKWLNAEAKYWASVNFRFMGNEPDHEWAIGKALKYGRPDLAVGCIYWALHHKRITDFGLCVDSLKKLAESGIVIKFDSWEVVQIIKDLQKRVNSADEQRDLVFLEFMCLSLLDPSVDSNASPATLNRMLATDPAFFQEIIGMIYKSDKQTEAREINKSYQGNAFRLLEQWDVVPGLNSDGLFDFSIFQQWYAQAIKLCEQSGHLMIAKNYIGQVLFYTPTDKDGLWINKEVASFLNKEENSILREGYHCRDINSRGVEIVDFSGKKDLDRAVEYNKKASDLEDNGFLVFAQTLRNLAKNSENDAMRNIKEGESYNHPEEL